VRFDPFTQEWKKRDVWVKMQATEFARGSVRACFRCKVLKSDDLKASWKRLLGGEGEDVEAELQKPMTSLPGLEPGAVAALEAAVRQRGAAGLEGSVVTTGMLLDALEHDVPVAKPVHKALRAAAGDEAEDLLGRLEVRRAALAGRAWHGQGCNRIAKCYLDKELAPDKVRMATEEDVVCQAVAKAWATAYNQSSVVPDEASLAAGEELRHPPKKVDFVALSLLELVERPRDGSRGERVYALEAVIEGSYRKFNNNSGMLVEDVHRQTPQALSHFAWERSGGRVMLADVQGVGDLLTDPVIHTASGKGFGKTNLGVRGMSRFFASHLHTPLLELLGLRPFGLSAPEVRRLPALIREFQLHGWDKTAAGAAGTKPPTVAFLAGSGERVGLEEAAKAAMGPRPLGLVSHDRSAADEADAVRRAASGAAMGGLSMPSAAPRSASTGPGLAVSMTTASSAVTAAYGRAPSGARVAARAASGSSPAPGLRRASSNAGRDMSWGALAPATHLMRTHLADDIAKTGAGAGGIVSVPMVQPGQMGDMAEEDEEDGEDEEAAAGGTATSGASDDITRGDSASLKILHAALPASPAAKPSASPPAGAALAPLPSPALNPSQQNAFTVPELGGGDGAEAIPGSALAPTEEAAAPAAASSSAVAEKAAAPGAATAQPAGVPTFRLVFGAVHFDLALCHATGLLAHFPEVDPEAVGFHLATAAEHFPAAALAAAKLASGETAQPFPDGCIAESPVLAFRWFHRAASMGSRAAMVRLSDLFLRGVEAPGLGDAAQELALWTGLSPFKDAEDAATLAVEREWVGAGIKADARLGVHWLMAAVKTDAGDDATRVIAAESTWWLLGKAAALFASGGPGLEPDADKARELYEQASEGAGAAMKFKAAQKYLRCAAALG